MATERLCMRHTREILRQKWLFGRSHREIARCLRVGLGTITGTVHRAEAAGLDWPQIQVLADDALEARLYGLRRVPEADRPLLDCAYIHPERRKSGVTLELLHLEYLDQHPDGAVDDSPHAPDGRATGGAGAGEAQIPDGDGG